MKKILCLTLSIVLVLCAFIVPTSAKTEAIAGYSADRVVKVDLTNIPDINDAAKGAMVNYDNGTAWKITDAAGMETLSWITNEAVKDFSGKTVYLAKDIDMSSVTNFKPIAYNTVVNFATTSFNAGPFWRGIFDGQGYAIKGLTMVETNSTSSTGSTALFGSVRGGAIRNLIIDETCSFTYEGTPAGTWMLSAVVAFGFTQGNESTSGQRWDAESAPTADRVDTPITYLIDNVWNKANVTVGNNPTGNTKVFTGAIIGAISGATGHTPLVQYCTNSGTLTGARVCGGIVGQHTGRSIAIYNCVSDGAVTWKQWGGAFIGATAADEFLRNNVDNTQKVKLVGTQIADNDGTYDVRFVSVINEIENVANVGYTVTVSYADKSTTVTRKTNTVYENIMAGEDTLVKAGDFGGKYFMALSFTEIPDAAGDVTFTVTPFRTVDGQTQNYKAYTLVYNAGALVSCTEVQ